MKSFVLTAIVVCPLPTLVITQSLGQWSPLINFPLVPVAAYIVPEFPESNRLLMFSAFANFTFGGSNGKTQFADYNYRTGAISHREVANTQHDMFCPGMSSLTDGRLVITGGSTAQATTVYTPSSNSFTKVADMRVARGYHSSVTLSNGNVFTIGGSWSGARGGKDGEVYSPSSNSWTLLPGADVDQMLTDDHEGIWREDNLPWLFAWRNGYVFQAGPSKIMHWISTSGTGSIQAAGTRDGSNDAMCGVNVMYDIGKIFAAGGAQYYDGADRLKRAYVITIDQPGQAASVQRLPDMSFARGFANAVVLPDGKVFVSGGQSYVTPFTDSNASLTPELFDPQTNTFTSMAPESTPRNYHSVSILLSDGRVFSGGGGLCGNGCAQNHPNAQIFTPPYLLTSNGSAATRPVISSVSATSVAPGGEIRVTIAGSGGVSGMRFALVRIGSVTHSINSDQRRVPLVPSSTSGQTATLRLPSDAGVVVPGHWFLFAMSADGVPSIAKTIAVRI